MPEVKAFAAVSPVIELEACMQSIERRENRIYEWNFCRNLQARMRRKARVFPGAFDLTGLWKVWSIRAFDDRYTAPHHGFNGAEDYYHRASAMRVIDRVARPSLILSAADDPFVPPAYFRYARGASQPAHHHHRHGLRRSLRVRRATPREAREQRYDGYFAEKTVVDFLDLQALERPPDAADTPRACRVVCVSPGVCMSGDNAKKSEIVRGPRLEWQRELDATMEDIDSRLVHPRRRATDTGPQPTPAGTGRGQPHHRLLDEIAWRVAEQMRRHALAFPTPAAEAKPSAAPPVQEDLACGPERC